MKSKAVKWKSVGKDDVLAHLLSIGSAVRSVLCCNCRGQSEVREEHGNSAICTRQDGHTAKEA